MVVGIGKGFGEAAQAMGVKCKGRQAARSSKPHPADLASASLTTSASVSRSGPCFPDNLRKLKFRIDNRRIATAMQAPSSTAAAPALTPGGFVYRPDIDGLRALAVLAVMAYHAFPSLVPGGFVGVDVFFVISGYLITKIIIETIDRGNFSLVNFYQKRIRRLFPSLLVVLTASLLLGWQFLLADEYRQLAKHLVASLGFVVNFTLHQEIGYFDNEAETKPLLHLWSLSVEEQFYLIWPVWLGLLHRYAPTARLWGVALGCGLFIAVLLWRLPEGAASYYLPLSRFMQILAGALIVGFERHPWRLGNDGGMAARRFNNPALTAWGGFALLGASLALLDKSSLYPSEMAVLPVGGALLVLAAGAHAWPNRKLLSHRLLVWIGRISYPLYLWHWVLLSFAVIIEGKTPPAEIRAIALVVSIALAWITYVAFEKPFRHGAAGAAKTTMLLASAAVLLSAGLYIVLQEGVRSRAMERQNPAHTFGAPYRDSCNALTQERRSDDWCNPGNTGKKTPDIVMIGDSYANAYSTMLGAYLKSSSNTPLTYRQFGRGLCPMVLDYGPADCRDFSRKALAYIATQQHISTVIIAARWPAYYSDLALWAGHRETPEAFHAALKKTLEVLQQGGKKVRVLLAPPTGGTPRLCIDRGIGELSAADCTLKRAKAVSREGDHRQKLVKLLDAQRVPYFDAYDFLCDTQDCVIMSAQKILYIDGEHLSIFGGEYLAREARQALDDLLRK